jgi:hypothetical protein
VHLTGLRFAGLAQDVKTNAPTLHDHVATFFTDAQAVNFEDVAHPFDETVDTAHGRHEVRRTWAVTADGWPLAQGRWPKLKTMMMIERERTVGTNETEFRTDYYLCCRKEPLRDKGPR